MEISELAKLLEKRQPVVDRFLPKTPFLSGHHLNLLNEYMVNKVKTEPDTILRTIVGTILFDGWDDINCYSVFNVLIRTEKDGSSARITFFLNSMYSGRKKVNGE